MPPKPEVSTEGGNSNSSPLRGNEGDAAWVAKARDPPGENREAVIVYEKNFTGQFGTTV